MTRTIDPIVTTEWPTARSLPVVWVWGKDGIYRAKDVIEGMATGVIGEDRDAEIVLYCGAGSAAGARRRRRCIRGLAAAAAT